MLKYYTRKVQCDPQNWKLFIHETYCENVSFLTAASKSKVYYRILPEPDLGVVIEEENEEEEDIKRSQK